MARTAQHVAFAELPRESFLGGAYQRTAVRGDHSLVTFNWMDPSLERQPPHSHDFDQLAILTEGAMEFEVDGETFLVQAGEALVIPANALHTATVVGEETAFNIDVYAPPREDYLYLTRHQEAAAEPTPLSAADTSAVAALHAEWAYRLDHGNPHAAGELLTGEAVVAGLGPEIQGREGFRQWAEARAAKTDRVTHHQISNLRYTAQPDGAITGTAYVTLYVVDNRRPEPAIEFVGEYTDRIVRTPAGLKFARREITSMA